MTVVGNVFLFPGEIITKEEEYPLSGNHCFRTFDM